MNPSLQSPMRKLLPLIFVVFFEANSNLIVCAQYPVSSTRIEIHSSGEVFARARGDSQWRAVVQDDTSPIESDIRTGEASGANARVELPCGTIDLLPNTIVQIEANGKLFFLQKGSATFHFHRDKRSLHCTPVHVATKKYSAEITQGVISVASEDGGDCFGIEEGARNVLIRDLSTGRILDAGSCQKKANGAVDPQTGITYPIRASGKRFWEDVLVFGPRLKQEAGSESSGGGQSVANGAENARAENARAESARAENARVTNAHVDFEPYLSALNRQVERAWIRPRVNTKTVVAVHVEVLSQGKVTEIKLEKSSGIAIYDQAALAAVQNATPFRPLPAGAPEKLDLSVEFYPE